MNSKKIDLRRKLQTMPHRPGVYLMRDRLGKVIYVGKAKDLRKRLANYFTPARSRLADRKTRALIDSIWGFSIHEVRNEEEALILEQKLIKEYRPKYNVSFRDDKRYPLVKVHLDEPYPKFKMVRLRKEDGARYFGPFPHSNALKATMDWMVREYGLRGCSPMRPGESDYRHCHDDLIRNCSAPCVGKVTREGYMQRVADACRFLEGNSKEALSQLEGAMEEAAAKLDFERAASLRDVMENVKKTLRPARNFYRGTGVPVPRGGDAKKAMEDVDDLAEALGMERKPLVMECFDISNISTAHCVASMVRFSDGVSDNKNYRRYRIRSVDGQDDFASMAEVVRRRYSGILLGAREAVNAAGFEDGQESPLSVMRRLEGEDVFKGRKVRLPDLVVVDGGKGQLSSAYKELLALGLGDLPLIGLAKEREEIFRPGESRPVVLPHERGGLRLLQRIRDEAHRFANGYHQLLMKRRVEESILDDCPGVSERRKIALLKAFGSVTRLRKASVEEIGKVSGVGAKLAEELVAFLKTHRR